VKDIFDPIPTLSILTSPDWKDYALLDSGNGEKLERLGPYRLIRPEAEAMWRPALPEKEWRHFDGRFFAAAEENGGHWETSKRLPKSWTISYKEFQMKVLTSASRHVGVFPEQASQWEWTGNRIQKAGRLLKVLNLFGYTGMASLTAAAAGAAVTHVDASRKAVSWAKENQMLSNLGDRSIRWIVDDALKFAQREARRDSRYDGVILDPPKFGRGPKGEVWEFYRLIPELLQSCRQILSPDPVFVVITAYAVKASSLTLYTTLAELMSKWRGNLEAGEIALKEESAGRLLSTAIFTRWSAC